MNGNNESQGLRETLAAIRRQRGVLNAEVVVEEARSPDHVLHSRFEWDDGIAAHKYRLVQAAELLRVTYRPAPEKPPVRAFWPVRDGSPVTDYQPIEEVAADDFQARLLLQTMEREWQRLRIRFGHMSEFVDMVRDDLDSA